MKSTVLHANVLDEIKRSDVQKIKVAVTDVDGVLRGKYLHRDKFLSAVEGGFGFCNVIFGWDSSDQCYDNSQFTGWHSGYPDVQAQIDLSTFRRVPWAQNVPFFLADFHAVNGQPLPICPRQTLKGVLARAEKMGFKAFTGMEFEWFNFQETSESLHARGFHAPKPITPGMFGYSLLRMNQNQPFFAALMDELQAFGVPIEGLHTETGPGVFEAAILFSEALESADRAVLFKSGAKEIGQRFGIMPSFMAKWNKDLPGCSGHIHASLWSGDQNVFYDAKRPHRMSDVFESFVAGLLHCLPELLPFYAPTVNSYKRLVDGYWAPTKVAWGIDNRTVAARVIPGAAKSTRVELRVPGSDANPYLAVAACIGSGLYGIENKLKLKMPPVKGSAYLEDSLARLPRSLIEATTQLEQSEIAREIFGDEFVTHFVNSRKWEWNQYQNSVTDWELKRYFEII